MISDIIGQSKIKRFFSNELMQSNLSYGYIIEGSKFMGKSFIAAQIGEELTISSYISELLPGDGRKLIQVDDIRTLKQDAYSQSYGKAKKVYIVPNADVMTISAQNAFLKLLEEPPQDCVFILLAVNRQNLLETIRSRCTSLVLARYNDVDIVTYLTKQGIESDPELIRLSNGIINRYGHLASPEFTAVRELAFRIIINIHDLHNARIFAIFKHIKKLEEFVPDILDIFTLWYRDLYVYKMTHDDKLLEYSNRIDAIKQHSDLYTEERISDIINKINYTRVKLHYNCNLEMTINSLLLFMKGVV